MAKHSKPNAPPALKKRGPGRPPHVATAKDAAYVGMLIAGGVVQERIAEFLGIHVTTLRKRYRKQIRAGQTEIDTLAVNALVRAMRGGGKESVTAAMWWQKSRMGWTEKLIVDDGKADAPMRVIVELVGEAAAPVIDIATPKPRSGFDPRSHVELVG